MSNNDFIGLLGNDDGNSRPADGGKVYAHRQGAYRRVKQLNDGIQKTRKFRYHQISEEDLFESPFIDEAKEGERDYHESPEWYRIEIENEAEAAIACYFPKASRLGISWGADPTFADVEDLESGIDMYLNDGEEWERRN